MYTVHCTVRVCDNSMCSLHLFDNKNSTFWCHNESPNKNHQTRITQRYTDSTVKILQLKLNRGGDWLPCLRGSTTTDKINTERERGEREKGRLTHQDIIPRGDWLAGILYPKEIDSPGYYTPRRLTRRDIIPEEITSQVFHMLLGRDIDSPWYYTQCNVKS